MEALGMGEICLGVGGLGVSFGSLGGAEGKRKSWGSGGDPFGWEENVLGEWMKCWEI